MARRGDKRRECPLPPLRFRRSAVCWMIYDGGEPTYERRCRLPMLLLPMLTADTFFQSNTNRPPPPSPPPPSARAHCATPFPILAYKPIQYDEETRWPSFGCRAYSPRCFGTTTTSTPSAVTLRRVWCTCTIRGRRSSLLIRRPGPCC